MAKPATIRPTSMQAKLFAPDCMAQPQSAIEAPIWMVRLRPSLSLHLWGRGHEYIVAGQRQCHIPSGDHGTEESSSGEC